MAVTQEGMLEEQLNLDMAGKKEVRRGGHGTRGRRERTDVECRARAFVLGAGGVDGREEARSGKGGEMGDEEHEGRARRRA